MTIDALLVALIDPSFYFERLYPLQEITAPDPAQFVHHLRALAESLILNP